MRDELRYGSEKPVGYLPRVVDARIRSLLDLFGAVEVAGTKWCGKTWSALAFGESVVRIDDERVKNLVAADPALALEGAQPHVVDEWQEVPSIWDAARRAIDASGSRKGSYLLTGSSTPEKDKVTHSGAGRIARVCMHTMSLWEEGRRRVQCPLRVCSRGRSNRISSTVRVYGRSLNRSVEVGGLLL